MKSDLEIPEVTHVFVAAIQEKNKDFGTLDWNAYLINDSNSPLETVLILTKGFDGKKATSSMRHSLKVLPPKSFAKIELLQDDVLALNNEFSVSFFSEEKLFHKKFLFEKTSIKQANTSTIPVMGKKGVLAN